MVFVLSEKHSHNVALRAKQYSKVKDIFLQKHLKDKNYFLCRSIFKDLNYHTGALLFEREKP